MTSPAEQLSVPDKQVFSSAQYVDDNSGAVIEKKTRAERLFVLRLDLILLFYCCVSQIMKGLDQQSRSSVELHMAFRARVHHHR